MTFFSFGASSDVLLGETRHRHWGEEELSWQPWRKFTFRSSLVDEGWEAPAQLLISGSQGLQTVQSCLSASCSHGAIWQPSSYLPATALAGAAHKAGREEKAALRASQLPGKWEESSLPPHLRAGILGFAARSHFSVAELTLSFCWITNTALQVCMGYVPGHFVLPTHPFASLSFSPTSFDLRRCWTVWGRIPSLFSTCLREVWGLTKWYWDAEEARVASLQPSPPEHAADRDRVLGHSSKSTPRTHANFWSVQQALRDIHSRLRDSSERLSMPK